MEAHPDGDDQKRLLIVADNPGLCDFISDITEEEGYSVAVAHSDKDFMKLLPSFRPHLIILDLGLPDRDATEQLRFLAKKKRDAKIVLMGFHERAVLDTIMKLGESYGLRMHMALQRPFGQAELKNALA